MNYRYEGRNAMTQDEVMQVLQAGESSMVEFERCSDCLIRILLRLYAHSPIVLVAAFILALTMTVKCSASILSALVR